MSLSSIDQWFCIHHAFISKLNTAYFKSYTFIYIQSVFLIHLYVCKLLHYVLI